MSIPLRHSARNWAKTTLLARQALARFSTSRRWQEELYPSKRVDYESKYAKKLQKKAEEYVLSSTQQH